MSLWLDRLNYYRSLANLAAVSEDSTLSNGYTQGNQFIEGDQQLALYELTTHNYGHTPPNPPNPPNGAGD